MKYLIVQASLKFVSGLLVLGVLLFLPAGSFRYAGAWRLIGLLFIPMLLVGAVLLAKAPELLQKRLNDRESEGEQKAVIAMSALELVVSFVLAGLDYRFG